MRLRLQSLPYSLLVNGLIRTSSFWIKTHIHINTILSQALWQSVTLRVWLIPKKACPIPYGTPASQSSYILPCNDTLSDTYLSNRQVALCGCGLTWPRALTELIRQTRMASNYTPITLTIYIFGLGAGFLPPVEHLVILFYIIFQNFI